MNKSCSRMEVLVGAIALGEATPSERDEYRHHIAQCEPCLQAFGGERRIEQTMETIARARDSEVWEPALLDVRKKRARRVAPIWKTSFAVVSLAVAISLGLHVVFAAAVPVQRVAVAPVPVEPAFHVTLESKSKAIAKAPATTRIAAQPATAQIVVVHNVIDLKQPTREATDPVVRTQRTTTVADVAATQQQSSVPVWRRNAPLPIAGAQSASQVAQSDAPAPLVGRAESMAIVHPAVIHDVVPVGGDTAISPRPPMIAYSLGAEGTTAFDASVDERGLPVRCTITKSSGYAVLDKAVCTAAMKARYQPRTVDGRATVGIYRDAFTFRSENQDTAPQTPF